MIERSPLNSAEAVSYLVDSAPVAGSATPSRELRSFPSAANIFRW
jgi:hypothetical protein